MITDNINYSPIDSNTCPKCGHNGLIYGKRNDESEYTEGNKVALEAEDWECPACKRWGYISTYYDTAEYVDANAANPGDTPFICALNHTFRINVFSNQFLVRSNLPAEAVQRAFDVTKKKLGIDAEKINAECVAGKPVPGEIQIMLSKAGVDFYTKHDYIKTSEIAGLWMRILEKAYAEYEKGLLVLRLIPLTEFPAVNIK